jgi:hypothetical protein
LKRFLKFTGWSAGILLLVSLVAVLGYRIPTGEPIVATAIVKYEMLDLGQGDFPRTSFESIFGNRRIFLAEGPIKYFYASFAQVQECWPESPFQMREKGYTVQVTFTVRKLLLTSGYTVASDVRAQRVPGNPDIVK